jgi:hypothetical protein
MKTKIIRLKRLAALCSRLALAAALFAGCASPDTPAPATWTDPASAPAFDNIPEATTDNRPDYTDTPLALNPNAGPATILPRLEKAYNDQDIYAIIECFEPSVSQLLWGVSSLLGIKEDAAKNIIPFASQALGASGAMDSETWGSVALTGISEDISGTTALLTYNVSLTYKNGTKSSFEETIQTVEVGGQWYIAAFQSYWEAADPVTAREIFPQEYEGELFAASRDGKWGFVNEFDEVIFPFEYDDAGEFVEDRCRVYSSKDQLWGYIDKRNVFIGASSTSSPNYIYADVRDFKDGLAIVRTANEWGQASNWGAIDKNGETVIPFEYEAAGSFADGLLPLKLNGYWGFVDKSGKTVIDFMYTDVFYTEYHYQPIDQSRHFINGRMRVCINDAWGVIDTAGKYLIPLSQENDSISMENTYPENSYFIVTDYATGYNTVYDWDGNVIKSNIKMIHCHFDDGALLVSCSSFNSGKLDAVRYDVSIISVAGEIDIDSLVAESLGVPIISPESDSHIANQKYLYGVLPWSILDDTYENVEWQPLTAHLAAESRDGELWRSGYYSNYVNSKGLLLENTWTEKRGGRSVISKEHEPELSDGEKARQAFTSALSDTYVISRFIQDNVAIITDENGIFCGLAAYRNGTVYNDYPVEYTKIDSESYGGNTLILEKGATTTRVWVGPNGYCFEL